MCLRMIRHEAHQLVGPGETLTALPENLQLGLVRISLAICKVQLANGVSADDLRSNISRVVSTIHGRCTILSLVPVFLSILRPTGR